MGLGYSFDRDLPGKIGTVTDNNNGTYTAIFTAGTNPGTDTITASINGQAVTGAAPTVRGSRPAC